MGAVKMSASGLTPGDSVRRVVDLTTSGSEDGTVHLLVTLTLPGGSGTHNRFQGLVSALTFSFTGIGRDVMTGLETGALAGTGDWSWPNRQGG